MDLLQYFGALLLFEGPLGHQAAAQVLISRTELQNEIPATALLAIGARDGRLVRDASIRAVGLTAALRASKAKELEGLEESAGESTERLEELQEELRLGRAHLAQAKDAVTKASSRISTLEGRRGALERVRDLIAAREARLEGTPPAHELRDELSGLEEQGFALSKRIAQLENEQKDLRAAVRRAKTKLARLEKQRG